MPTVTSGVDALLSITGTTTAAGTLTKALQGAEADPTKIGAEYMPDVLDPTAIIVPDFPVAYVPPINSIGMRDGQLAVGDGVTEQGVLVVNKLPIMGLKELIFSGPNTGQTIPIVALPLTADDTDLTGISGKLITVFGTVDIKFITGQPTTNIMIGIANEANKTEADPYSNPPNGWLTCQVHPNPGVATIVKGLRLVLSWKVLAFGGNGVELDWSGANAITWCHIYGDGTDNITSCAEEYNSSYFPVIDGATAQDLHLVMYVKDAAGMLDQIFQVNYNLGYSVADIP